MQEIMLRKWSFFKKTQTFSKKRLDFPKKKCIIYLLRANPRISQNECGSGGTGRRARLRGVWFTPYGFKSRFPHQKEQVGNRLPALFLREAGVTRTSVCGFACKMPTESASKRNSGGNIYRLPSEPKTPLVRSSSPVFRTKKSR